MIEFIQPYIGITLKLVTGMIGILAFLRITGKAQMAQLTPLDTVSAFVIGALVGGVLYNPDMSVWHLLFALAVWTGFNMLVRFAMRSARLRHIIKGESVFLVKNGVINFKNFKRNSLEMEQFRLLLRQKGIFSMFEVEDVLFEAMVQLQFYQRVRQLIHSYLLTMVSSFRVVLSRVVVHRHGHYALSRRMVLMVQENSSVWNGHRVRVFTLLLTMVTLSVEW